ncbi:hypothetical protein [Anoxynatronum sibiricum]
MIHAKDHPIKQRPNGKACGARRKDGNAVQAENNPAKFARCKICRVAE